nr:signal peptidase complex subunit 1 [Pogona vitticeps]
MRQSKITSLPVNPASPALRRQKASASESGGGAAALRASASDASSQGDSLQLPERKAAAAGGRAAAAARPSPDASLQPALRDPSGPAPRLLPARADGEPGAQGSAGQAGTMLGIFRSIPTQMDYKGQKLAEQIFQGIILFSAVIGFIYGYITEQFGWTVYIVMAGFALSCLLTLPPWPIYRRNPLKWLPVQESTTDDKKPADRKVKRHPKN